LTLCALTFSRAIIDCWLPRYPTLAGDARDPRSSARALATTRTDELKASPAITAGGEKKD